MTETATPPKRRRRWIPLWVGRLWVGVFVLGACGGILLVRLDEPPADLEVGDVAQQDYLAQTTFQWEDTAETERLREEQAAQADVLYSPNPAVGENVGTYIETVFDALAAVRTPVEVSTTTMEVLTTTTTQPVETTAPSTLESSAGSQVPETTTTVIETTTTTAAPVLETPNAGSQLTALRAEDFYDDFPPRAWLAMTSLETDQELNFVRDSTLRAFSDLVGQKIRPEELAGAIEEFRTVTVPNLRLSIGISTPDPEGSIVQGVEEFVFYSITNLFDATEVLNEEGTQALQDEARARVEPQLVTILSGMQIVGRGEVLTERQIGILTQDGQLNIQGDLADRARSAALIGAALLFLALYVRTYRRSLWNRPGTMLALGLLLTIHTATAWALATVVRSGEGWWGFLLPAALISIMVAVLVDGAAALIIGLISTLLTGLAFENSFIFAAFNLLTAVAVVPFVADLSTRTRLWRAALMAAVTSALAAGAVGILAFEEWRTVVQGAGAGFAGGLAGGLLAIGLLPIFEALFDITTPLRLLDLTDRSHPLMRQLQEKAFGTYNHSIIMGTMAEAAAQAIGANGLLARAAAYYHDIGKTENPSYFIENQFTGQNPHDDVLPSESAAIIRAHVIDGWALARKYRLPAEVAEGIMAHHGTGKIRYFWTKALQQGVDQVEEANFRHAGRKPVAKEMGILMLADSVEGASRAFAQNNKDLTERDLRDLVGRIIDEKIDDGQLSECALTLGDVTTIKDTFTRTLVGIYHPRIEYPDDPEVVEIKRWKPKKPSEGQG